MSGGTFTDLLMTQCIHDIAMLLLTSSVRSPCADTLEETSKRIQSPSQSYLGPASARQLRCTHTSEKLKLP